MNGIMDEAALRGQDREVGLDFSSKEDARTTQRVKQQSDPRFTGPSAAGTITPEQLAKMIDHTLLRPEASTPDIRKLCEEAIQFGFFSICVNSSNVKFAHSIVGNSSVIVCCAIGFPLGAQTPEIKALEARQALRDGAREIDMVINIGALKSKEDDVVLKDIRGVVEACKESHARCKVILETSLLTDEEKVRACQLTMKAGADFVKTSTGFSNGGATAEDVALLARTVAPKKLGVKASGGIRTVADAIKMIRAGATRIGSSHGVNMIEEANAANIDPRKRV
jgi:deoxyribose-phosphate aldolase